jgi:hypothetical protein
MSVAYDGVVSETSGSGTSGSRTITVPTTTDLLVAALWCDSNIGSPTCKVGANGFTEVALNTGNPPVCMWFAHKSDGVFTPGASTQVDWAWTNSRSFEIVVACFKGVRDTAPETYTDTVTGTSLTGTALTSAVSTGLVVGFCGANNDALSIVAGGGATALQSGNRQCFMYKTSPTPGFQPSWSWTNSIYMVGIGAAFYPTPAGNQVVWL